MSFRARLTLVAAVAVAVAVAVLSVATYLIAADVLYGQVDTELQEQAREAVLRDTPAGFVIRLPPGRSGRAARSRRSSRRRPTDLAVPPEIVPVVDSDRAVAAGRRAAGSGRSSSRGCPSAPTSSGSRRGTPSSWRDRSPRCTRPWAGSARSSS